MKKPASTLPSMLVSLILAVGASLSFTVLAQDVKPGDKVAGEKKASMCIGCHGIPGYQASFPEIHKVPMIAGQSAKYLSTALAEYKKGDRKHPTMKGVAAALSEQDMADLAAFYETQPKDSTPAPAKLEQEPNSRVADLLKKSNCQSCHGENLSKPIDPTYPKIAGQHADYLYVALKSYQTKGNPQVGRTHAIMGAMATPYSHAELKELAQYIGGLPGELRTVPQSRFR